MKNVEALEGTIELLLEDSDAVRKLLGQKEARIEELEAAVLLNHAHHTEYDEDGGYEGSELESMNMAVLS